jgi:hypothetical protein
MEPLLPLMLFLLLFSFSLLYIAFRRQQQRYLVAKGRGEHVLADCRRFAKLIGHLQQHRGTSSAWLSGDASFAPKLAQLQGEIGGELPALKQLAEFEGQQPQPVLTTNDFRLFQHRWQTLLEELPTLTPEQSIARHTALIGELLDWLTALGEARLAPVLGETEWLGLVRNYAHRLPALAECLGQARAVGSGVAARHACPPVARVRLMFLIGRAESLLDQASRADANNEQIRQARQAVQALAETVRGRMLQSAGVDVSSTEYFALASRAIERVYGWMEEVAGRLAQQSSASLGLGTPPKGAV